MTFTDELWDNTTDVYQAITAHPFVTGLGDGSLPRETFTYYMAQDGLYLGEYARVLAGLAAQCDNPDDLLFWVESARTAIVVERQLHASHVDLKAETPMSPTCRAYTSFLLGALESGSYAVAAAAVLPCYWIYQEVGQHLLSAAGDLTCHAYGDWISMYADEEFARSVRHARYIVDRLGERAPEAERARMHEAYATAARYEWMFWDAAWRKEVWAV